ncbi:MAG: hypothetical protein ACK5LT_07965 [Lachnospirales bacterium]
MRRNIKFFAVLVIFISITCTNVFASDIHEDKAESLKEDIAIINDVVGW